MSKKLPEGWKKVKLGEVIKVDGGYAFKSNEFVENEIPIVRIGSITERGIKLDNSICYSKDFNQVDKYKIIKGDILIAMSGATVGKLAMYNLDELALLNQRVGRFNIADKKVLNNRFLLYILISETMRNKIVNMASGCAQPNISGNQLESIEFNLPPLEEQERIVSILERAESAIQKRKECNRLLDELVKSRFIEMFGDPVNNPKGWNKEKLNDLGVLARGKSKHRPRNAPELLNGPYPLVQTGDISNAGIYLKEYTQTYSELGLKQSKMWDKGTLCITIAANIAKTSILTFDACFPDSVVAFIPNEKTNNMFIQIWMSFLQKILEDSAPESAQKNINLKILSEQDVIVPPIELQNKFSEFIDQVEKLKFEMEASLKELEKNFNSLMQRAFNGEL